MNFRFAAGAALSCVVLPSILPAAEPVVSSALRFSTTVSVEESFDSDVFRQSTTPLANQSSWVTSLGATFTLGTPAAAERSASLTYAPAWTVFHSAQSEDFFAHQISANTVQRFAGAKVTAQASANIIDGSDESIVWTGVGGPPAVGAPSVRDRRDQTVYRASVGSEWTTGRLTVRPSGSLYWADFQTAHRSTPGYQNFVDRGDISVGTDILTPVAPKLKAGLGARYGGQAQAGLLDYAEEYDNRYVRLVALLDGEITPWCTVSVTAGPEFRHYGDAVHATFAERSPTLFYYDAKMVFLASRQDTVTLASRQFQQMSASGRGAFDDLYVDLAWRHTFSPQASAGLVLHAYNTTFLLPALRDDWVYTARLHGRLVLSERWSLEAALTIEEGASDIPSLPGREYTREACSFALKARL